MGDETSDLSKIVNAKISSPQSSTFQAILETGKIHKKPELPA